MTNDFLYYSLLNKQDTIKKFDRGSSQPSIRKTDLLSMEIEVPPILEQKAIANILSSFDDKIEVNNKINKNLEELAQTLYKHWFVDFEFPDENGNPYKSSGGKMIESELGLIPEGWEVKEVIDLFNFVGGSQPPKKEHIYENKEGYVRFIQNRDYSGNDNHITYIKESPRNKLCDETDIMMDKYGEAGKVRFGISGAYNVALAKIDSKDVDKEYLRRYFEQSSIENYILNASQASTRPSVNQTVFTNLKVAYPPTKLLNKFNEISRNIIIKTLLYRSENKKLAEMRDLLLPKLMSGEIRLPIEE
jgi:type I restriction enzyme S subunit